MPSLSTPAIVLATFRYGETSKIVRLATESVGVQSAIAKGAMRPKSRFGAALQVLSEGHAHLIIHGNRDLQLLTAFDLQRIPVRHATEIAKDCNLLPAARSGCRHGEPWPNKNGRYFWTIPKTEDGLTDDPSCPC